MKTFKLTFVFVVLSSAVLSGCTKKVPKCSSSAVTDVVTRMIVRSYAEVKEENFSDAAMFDYVKVTNIQTESYEKEFDRYTCSGLVLFGNDLRYPVSYNSYIDESNGEHMISVGGMSLQDKIVVALAIKEQRKRLLEKSGSDKN